MHGPNHALGRHAMRARAIEFQFRLLLLVTVLAVALGISHASAQTNQEKFEGFGAVRLSVEETTATGKFAPNLLAYVIAPFVAYNGPDGERIIFKQNRRQLPT